MADEPIAESEVEVSFWNRMVLSNMHGEMEASGTGVSEFSLQEIEEGSPIVKYSTEDTTHQFYFDDAKEMRGLGEWLTNQADLVESWCEHYDDLAEEFEESDKDYGWFDEKRKPPRKWWEEHTE